MNFLQYNPKLKERSRELRKNMTSAEKIVRYKILKNCGCTILRQKPIDNFIVDFYIPSIKLVIEIDGDTHFEGDAQIYDQERTKILEGLGLTVLRFTNIEVYQDLDGVSQKIKMFLIKKSP